VEENQVRWMALAMWDRLTRKQGQSFDILVVLCYIIDCVIGFSNRMDLQWMA